jgi:hypothetical protein
MNLSDYTINPKTDNLSLGENTVFGNEYQWNDLIYQCPEPDKLVRVKTVSGKEYICETYEYKPDYDEIGHGSSIIQFAKLNGDWIDDTEIRDWCYIR